MAPDSNELNTWAEIAFHLKVSIRTAQNWEKSLGLPVKRITEGSKGRVLAVASELDQWKAQRILNGSPATEPAQREAAASSVNQSIESGWHRNRWHVLTAVVCLGTAILGWASRPSRDVGQIAAINLEGRFLVVKDKAGREAWRHYFEQGFFLYDPEKNADWHWIGDLDHDGRPELLYLYHPAGLITDPSRRESATLFCFSSHGQVKWFFQVGHTVRDVGGEMHPPFGAEAMYVFPAEASRQGRIVVASGHSTDQAYQLAFFEYGRKARR